ncbi:RadC family protein [Candidatus Pristimantibacillus sp. PTI5]|uniref:RadC family protein n=1 Tax=Candidatus Pristimantibacillus sp. PTI5 TaxID=3400422 RepID=UPI003B0154FB
MNISYTFRSALSDALCVKESSSVMDELFNRFTSPFDLLDATEQELTTIRGIGPMRAKQILSTLKLAQLLNIPKQAPDKIRSPKDVFELLRYEIGLEQKEFFVVLFLSTKNHIIGKETISIGSLNSAIVHPREVFKAACRRSACSIIAAHNHPSQDTTPSPEDIKLTKRLVEAGEIMGIELLDSMIVTGHSYCSLKERGLM